MDLEKDVVAEGKVVPVIISKRARKRKEREAAMKNGNISTNRNVVRKKTKKCSDESVNTEPNTTDPKMSKDELVEHFSVDMSKICPAHRPVSCVTIREIQQLLIFSLLGPNNGPLPVWANLDHTCVNGVVVVLLKYVTSKLFEKKEECFPKLGFMFDVVFPFDNYGYLMHIKSPAHSLLTVAIKLKNDDANEPKVKPVHGKDYVLTEVQLVKNDFIIPGISQDVRDFFTIPRSSEAVVTTSSLMFALDCEMCMSARDKELTRISVVDESLHVVYDTLVKPDQPITDYLTRFSGITAENLRDVQTTLKDVQKKLKEIIPHDAIIVGHSLEFDFTSLEFFHNKVIDTSVIYGDGRGMGFKPSLKYLARKYLKADIQGASNGHCSIEDARTCMKLVQLKIAKGPTFGMKDRPEKSLLDLISENSTKRGVVIDRASNVKQYSGNSDAIPCADDEEVVRKVIKVLPKYQFVWSQLHNMDTINTEKMTVRDEKMKPLLQQMDASISKIHDNLRNGTLFVVILGSADTSYIRSLRDKGTARRIMKKAEKDVKRGLCFMKLVNKSQETSIS